MPVHRTVEDSKHLQKADQKIVRIPVYPSTKKYLPYPRDYEIPPCVLPSSYERYADELDSFKVQPDDIWVVTFPKSGTTWIMNIVWQLKNNLNFSADILTANYNFFEERILSNVTKSHIVHMKDIIEAREKEWHILEDSSSPRIIKSHLPAQLLPIDVWTVKPKIIYVCRDPKDTAVSMYHFYRNCSQIPFSGTLETFFDSFLNDQLSFSPYCSHINSYRKLKELDNILILNYEDMKSNPFAEVKKINDFLGYKYSDDQLKQLTNHVSFTNMHKKNNIDPVLFPHGFNFFRKGEAGSYRDEMSPEYIKKFDEWMKKHNIMSNTIVNQM